MMRIYSEARLQATFKSTAIAMLMCYYQLLLVKSNSVSLFEGATRKLSFLN